MSQTKALSTTSLIARVSLVTAIAILIVLAGVPAQAERQLSLAQV